MTVVFLTGAGISTDSGVPDYRGPNGLWTRDPEAEKLVTYDYYVNDPDIRRRSWLLRQASPIWNAEPNAAHVAIAAVKDAWVLTQNVDRLHHRAGTTQERIAELHGNMFDAVCISCGEFSLTRTAVDRVLAGEHDPRCVTCGGILKTATVMFGQPLDATVLNRAVTAIRSARTVVAVGTSLGVYPAALLVDLAVSCGARLIIVNQQRTPYDGHADRIIRTPIGVAVPSLCAELGRTG